MLKKENAMAEAGKKKARENIAGAVFVWIAFWSMAVDSPGAAGLIAVGMSMAGVVALAAVLFIERKRVRR